MDFITELPTELAEFVLEYLTVEELLNASLVSQSWNSFIGTSSNLMKRMKMIFHRVGDNKELTADDKRSLIDSERRYQHMEISNVDKNTIGEIFELFESKITCIKTLKMRDVEIPSTKDIAEFIGGFEATLEQLELDSIIVCWVDAYEHREFEKLKILRLMNVDCNINCSNVFIKCAHLTEFRITARAFTIKYVRPIVRLLEQNAGLKVLEISVPIYDVILTKHVLKERIAFKLHTFKVSSRLSGWSTANFDEFFATQMNSLEKLEVRKIAHVKNLETIFKMPKLRELDLGEVEQLNVEQVRLSVNRSIEKLKFQDTHLCFNTMSAIVSAAPKTRELNVCSMTQSMMELMSERLQHLESLTMRTIHSEEMSDERLFPKLRHCSIEYVLADLHNHMEELPVDSRNPFVRLLLASPYTLLH